MSTEPVRRSSEIEDPTNRYFIHPLSALLVPVFARARVTPNTVSLLGMACGLLAGLCYHFYAHPACALAGFALMLGWHVMDGADGQLARLTMRFSEFGKVLDGICDYVTFTAVYLGLGLALSADGGWVLAVIALAGLCHAVQAAAFELQRQNYIHCAFGRASAALPSRNAPGGQGIAGWLYRRYCRVQLWAAAGAIAFNAGFAAELVAHPAQEAALRAAYRANFAPLIRRWGVLSSNYRTLGIFIAALLQRPLWYFVFEIFGFSLILALLLNLQKTRNARFLARQQAEFQAAV